MVYEKLDINNTSSYYVDGVEETLNNAPPAYALLFPWFTETVGVIIFFLTTHYKVPIPYAACLFVIGTLLGVYAKIRSSDDGADDPFTISILQWTSIDSDVLLLTFLPGLIFR